MKEEGAGVMDAASAASVASVSPSASSSSSSSSSVSPPSCVSSERAARSPLGEDIRKLMDVAHGQPPDASFSPAKRPREESSEAIAAESSTSSSSVDNAARDDDGGGGDGGAMSSDSIPIPHSSYDSGDAAAPLALPFSPSALTTALVEHRNSFNQHQHMHHQLQSDRLHHNLQLASNVQQQQHGGVAPPAPSSAPINPSLYPLLSPRLALPSLDVEVSIRFVHPETRKRRIVKAVIPLQREVSINDQSSFDYITAAQLIHALGSGGSGGGIDLQRWRVEIPDGIDHDYAEDAAPAAAPCCGESHQMTTTATATSSQGAAAGPRYVPLEMDAKDADAAAGDERLPLSIMWLPRGGGAVLFIDIRLVERDQSSSSSSSSSSASSSLSSSTSSQVPLDALGREGRAWMFGRDWNRTPHHRPFLLKDLSVVDVSCGSSHFLALTKEGRVFSWGSGRFGKLGHGSLEDITAPTLVQSIYRHHVTKIATGPRHSVALTERGEILVWGQAAITDDCQVQDLACPTLVKMSALNGITFKNISTACNHIAAVSMIGRPYYWAWSCKGSLVEPFAAKVIDGTEDMVVTDLCSSKNFVSMITAKELYTQVLQDKTQEAPQYAWTRYNQVLGNTNEDEKPQHRARKLYKETVTSRVRQIACNSNSLVALLESGEIVIIDVLESNSVVLSFLSDKNIIQIACGQNHLIALSDTGLVYTWGVDNHGALGHGKVVQQKSPLAIKALDEVLVQKVVCNKCCTIVLEDFWATQLLRVMAGMKGVATEDVKAIRSYAYYSPKERIMPSLHMAYQCHQSRYTGEKAGMLGWFFWSSAYTPKLGLSSVSLEFKNRERQPGVYDDKLTITNQSKQELKLAIALCHREKERRFHVVVDPVPEALAPGKSFDLTVRLHLLEPITVNMVIDLIVNDTCHHFVLIKLEKEHFVRPLGDLLTASSDMVGMMAAGASMSSSMALHGSFSSLTSLKNSYVDIFEDDHGLLVFVLQPTTSFSRKKSVSHLRSSSSSSPLSAASATAGSSSQTPPISTSHFSSSAIPVGFGMSAESLVVSSMSSSAAVRQNKSGSILPSESLAERTARGESQHSPTHSGQGLPMSEVLTIDFKNDEIEFHEELGRGASGATVYACSIKGMFFAAKIMDSSTFPSEEQIQRMLSEISIMAQLRHENVVRLLAFDYREDKKEIRMYTQIYPETLWQVIANRSGKGKPFTPKEVVDFAFQIARGLHYLGRQEPPIIHRDLKSDNIFVSWDNHRHPRRLHIGDFDTSKILETTGAKTFTQVGTPGWMAPEVFTESGRGHGVKADVWSFGMVLYELIVMKQPYFDKNHFEISTCNVKGIRPTVPDSVDKEAFKELLKLFNKCTNKKPQDRPSTADILATLAAM